ncbi:MAG TPA: TonB-dependent receptor, partial [Pyrinomonadaceae bacterium]
MNVYLRSRNRSWLVSLCSLVLLVLSLTPALRAQEPTGAVEGAVTDQQGAIVQNAAVTVRNTATNFSRTANTEDNGHYRISQLPPGTYEVKVTATNFKTSVASDVRVEVGRVVPLDVRLEVGGVGETVNVEGGGEAQVDRTDNTVAGVVNTRQIQNLPLNGRNFLDLAQLQPGTEKVEGASFDPTKANYTGVSIAGQAGRSTQITVDGGSVVDNIVGTTVQNFSQEIVQEFQIGISNYDLSTGASASGSVNIVSRSGSNEYHGNAYIYYRDAKYAALPSLSRLDAANGLPPAARANRIPFDREQFGGTLGGPIKKDKLFFFFNAEYNNQDGTAIHNTALSAPSFSGFTSNPFNELLLTGKVDWNINSHSNFFVRYSHDDNDQQSPFPSTAGIVPRASASGLFNSNDQVLTNRSDGIVAGYTRSFGSNLVNDLRYNYNNFKNVILPATVASGGLGELRIFNSALEQDFRTGTNYLAPQVTDQVRHQVRDDLTYTRGSHTFRFGGDYERTAIGGQFAFAKPSRVRLFGPDAGGPSTFNTEADFLAAPVRDITLGIGNDILPFNTPGGSTINHRVQIYGNDNWKISPKFTFNYGLAYRIDSNLWNHDLSRPSIIAPLFGKGGSPSPRDTNNFAPRVGFAWDIAG